MKHHGWFDGPKPCHKCGRPNSRVVVSVLMKSGQEVVGNLYLAEVYCQECADQTSLYEFMPPEGWHAAAQALYMRSGKLARPEDTGLEKNLICGRG